MSSSSSPSRQDFWLEPFAMEKHLQDFHELCADERAALWSSQRHSGSLQASRKKMEREFLRDPQKPWLVGCAVMSSEYRAPEEAGGGIGGKPRQGAAATAKMIGAVRTTWASPWGLGLGYKLRSDCWGRGYATRAIEGFLDVYWSQTRVAPRSEVYAAAAGKKSDGSAGVAAAALGKAAEVLPADAGENMKDAGSDTEDGDGDEEVEITHLIAQVDPMNFASMRVAEKCGGKLVTVGEKSVKVWRFEEMRDMAVWRLDKPSTTAST